MFSMCSSWRHCGSTPQSWLCQTPQSTSGLASPVFFSWHLNFKNKVSGNLLSSMWICSWSFPTSLWWKDFHHSYRPHNVLAIFFLGVTTLLQQDVVAATGFPSPSEVLDGRVVQWNLGLSALIVSTSAPTLSWLSVSVAAAAKLTAVHAGPRVVTSHQSPRHIFLFCVCCVTSFNRNAVILLVSVGECWKYCKLVEEILCFLLRSDLLLNPHGLF